MVVNGSERNDVPLNVNGPRSLVSAVDTQVLREIRDDPESNASRGSFVRRAVRFYLAHLARKRGAPA